MESKQMHDYEALRQLVLPHIESFDYFLDEGLEKAFLSIRPIEIVDPATQAKLRVSLEKLQLFPPMVEGRVNKLIFPNQCREARTTYKGEFRALVCFQYDDQVIVRESTRFGHLPIMLKSKLCHLRGADPQKLVFLKEEATEMGGYFICNGLERLARLLIIQKRNYPMSMVRRSFRTRGPGYSDKAVVMRCVREDQSSVTLKLYYLENGSARLGFLIGGREFLLPVGIILKPCRCRLAELHTMIHLLFLESCASIDLASRLLFVVLTVCVRHEAWPNRSKNPTGYVVDDVEEPQAANGETAKRNKNGTRQGPLATFDSYVLAAVCALACELQLFPLISKNHIRSESQDSPRMTKVAKTSGAVQELYKSIVSAVCHTHRILAILEALFSLKPSSIGTSWGYSSTEIGAAAMVAVSELFRRSKACMNALSVLRRCKWDTEISTRASSLYHLIDMHGKNVASIVHKAEPLEANLVCTPVWKDDIACSNGRKSSSIFENQDNLNSESSSCLSGVFSKPDNLSLKDDRMLQPSQNNITSMPVDAPALATFLTLARNVSYNWGAEALLRSVLAEKQELCFSVVTLLWHKLIAALKQN